MTGDYTPREVDGVLCVWLQGIGWHGAKPLGDVQVGDVLAYNYGGTATVTEVKPSVSGASVVLVVKDSKSGRGYTANARRAATPVAVCGIVRHEP